MLEKLKASLISGYLANILRHALTALGAVLIAQGLPEAVVVPWVDATVNLLLQALPIIVALVWSYAEKKSLKRALVSR